MAQSVDLNLRMSLAHDDGAPLTEDELQKVAFAAYRVAFQALRQPRALPFLHVEAEVTGVVLVRTGEPAALPALARAA